jgi:ABC-type dipeptide/oligopeptide/nickel transport system permease component
MARFLAGRLAMGLLTIWVTTVAVTLLIHLVPGDPVQIMYAQSQGTTPEQIEAVRQRLGLDRPIWSQYLTFMGRLLQGDLGETIRGQQPVLDLILQRLPNTLALAAAAMLIAMALGVTMGFLAAYRRGTWLDTALMVVAIGGISLPHFWLGLLLLFFFAVELGWLPVAGEGWRSLVLPALTLGLSNAAIVARMTRSAMLDVLGQDFVRTAEAKGLPEALVLHRHVLRPGLVPIVTMMGLQFTYMMGGAIVVENIFAWNGIGRLGIEAIFQRDYPMIQAFILVFAAVVVAVSILLDLAYALLDPRIRKGAS